jgi:hypothetical protein
MLLVIILIKNIKTIFKILNRNFYQIKKLMPWAGDWCFIFTIFFQLNPLSAPEFSPSHKKWPCLLL